MGSRNKIVADKRILRAHCVGENALKGFPSPVVISVSRGGGKMRLAHAVFDKSGQHFLLVILGCFVYFGKNRLKLVSHLIGNGVETLVH